MKKHVTQVALMILLAISVSGCATTLTLLNPARSEIVKGDIKTGPFSHYTYGYQIMDNTILLTRTPQCNEMATAYKVTKKTEIGYGPAMLEMPFFGLGLIDLLNANAIADNSKKTEPLADIETGKVLACGAPEPAADVPLVIQNKKKNISLTAATDENGKLDLNSVLGDVGPARLVIHLASNPDRAFICDYTGGRLASLDVPAVPEYRIVYHRSR